jgi:thiol:disulfide interchange protein DsbD
MDRMKHIFLCALALLFTGISFAQSGSAKQVTWTYSAKKLSGNAYELRMSATINGNYHMYAQQAGVEGPVPTTISFSPNPLVILDGKAREEGKPIRKFESAWDGNVNYFEKKVDFVQVVKLKAKAKTNVAGKIEFMVCNDNQCLPPSQVDFRIALN